MDKAINQKFNYRQVPVDYDGTGTITDIKGNTVVFNQQIQNGNFASTSNWAENSSTLTANNNVGSVVATAQYGNISTSNSINITGGHIVFFVFTAKSYTSVDTRIYLREYNSSNAQSNTYWQLGITKETRKYLVTLKSDTVRARILIQDNNVSEWGTIEVSNIMLMDLTLMGIDNLTTTTEVEQWLSSHIGNLSYYDYTQGKLLPFKGESLKTVGFNQWDEEWEVGNINPTTGLNETNNSVIRSKNYIPLLPNATYYFCGAEGNVGNVKPRYYDGNYVYIGTGDTLYPDSEFTPPNGACYFRFCLQSSYGTTYNNDICINISDAEKNGTYEPYTSNTLSLPISTYFPTGMKDVPDYTNGGRIFDELTENKAITRVGSVDLGSLGWSKQTAGSRTFFISNASDLPLAKNQYNFAILCAKYERTTSTVYDIGDKQITSNMNGFTSILQRVAIRDDNYSDADVFKTAMSGVYLNFELNAEGETTIDPPLDLSYEIEWGGTEQLLPENTSVPTTTPILCDIDYRGLITVNVTADPFDAGTVTGYGDKRYHSTATLTATPINEFHRFLRWEDENGDILSTNSTYSFKVGDE